jgi:zinc transporter 5/7
VAVIISSILINLYGWNIADPICSFALSVLIGLSVIPLLKSSAATLLQRSPAGFDNKLASCLEQIRSIPGVIQYSEPHFWANTSDDWVGSIHIVIDSTASEQVVLKQVGKLFKKKGVHQLTVQINKDMSATPSKSWESSGVPMISTGNGTNNTQTLFI